MVHGLCTNISRMLQNMLKKSELKLIVTELIEIVIENMNYATKISANNVSTNLFDSKDPQNILTNEDK